MWLNPQNPVIQYKYKYKYKYNNNEIKDSGTMCVCYAAGLSNCAAITSKCGQVGWQVASGRWIVLIVVGVRGVQGVGVFKGKGLFSLDLGVAIQKHNAA